jgi:hypothetical protein
MVADHWSGDPAETTLDASMITAIADPSRPDDGNRHRSVQASAIDLTTM